jgi:hypothetical protein
MKQAKGEKQKAKGRRLSVIFFLSSIIIVLSSSAQSPIGYWREHLNYQNTIQVVKGDKIYCATQNNFFSIDANNELERYSKINGLTEMGVSCLGWDDFTQQLIIAYNNSNVDVMKGSNIQNISDIKRSNISGNKTIYSIYCKNGLAYLSSGLGIIIVDLIKFEIKDTWLIGNNGNQIKVTAFTSDGSYFYAATAEGVKKAAINSNNLADFHNWINMNGSNGLSSGGATTICYVNNKLLTQKNDSLFVLNNSTWNLIYADTAWHIVNTNASSNNITVCQRTNAGASRVIELDITGKLLKTLSQAGIISFPQNALIDNNSIWIADLYGGLSNFSSTVQQYIPNGPPGTASGDLLFQKNILYAAAGTVDDAWNYTYNRNGIYSFINDTWSFKSYYNTNSLDSVFDFIALAADPRDESIWAGSYGGGLVNFVNDKLKIYKQNYLQPAIGDASSYRVSGLAFDQNNNLWISNYGAPQNLKVYKADGTWKNFSVPFSLLENAVSQIVVDDANQLWIVSPKGNGIICYNYGSSVDAINDDQWKYFRTGIGTGNLPSNNVYCVAKDKNGFIWVGTDKGVAIVQCATDVFKQNCDAVLPVIQQDQFAGYLFQNEAVQCIAVDGANRKWVGTKNGAWLVGADGDKIVTHFTVDNSPLLHNDVKKISIDPQTGEVFFATFTGICSYRGTATEASENTNVLVFPNPVPPNYNGTIAIRGLAENSVVKIAELNGRLVYQTRSLGGQAIWDGKNYNGTKALSGLYLVIARNDDGSEKLVTKIVMVGGK